MFARVKFLKLFQGKEKEPLPESELLARYRQSGDIALLGELYEPYMELVFAVSYKYFRHEEQSKDAVMQIFEKLITDLKTHQVGNFRTWLHSVARNYCLMQLRAARILVAADEIEEIEIAEEQSTEMNAQAMFEMARADRLEHCMKTLTEQQRISVEQFYLHQKCYREIAGDTGFEIGKVKSYIQNGKRNLKICMDKNGTN
jgi:RNA polymerase sigma-70 factor (ECF subfamily)